MCTRIKLCSWVNMQITFRLPGTWKPRTHIMRNEIFVVFLNDLCTAMFRFCYLHRAQSMHCLRLGFPHPFINKTRAHLAGEWDKPIKTNRQRFTINSAEYCEWQGLNFKSFTCNNLCEGEEKRCRRKSEFVQFVSVITYSGTQWSSWNHFSKSYSLYKVACKLNTYKFGGCYLKCSQDKTNLL